MIKTFNNRFKNADEAFQYWYQCIENYGTDFAGTKALFNIGFEMDIPGQNQITHNGVTGKKIMQKLNGDGIYQVIET